MITEQFRFQKNIFFLKRPYLVFWLCTWNIGLLLIVALLKSEISSLVYLGGLLSILLFGSVSRFSFKLSVDKEMQARVLRADKLESFSYNYFQLIAGINFLFCVGAIVGMVLYANA